MTGFPTPEMFVIVWQCSSSAEQVGRSLRRLGSRSMKLDAVLRWAQTFREAGVKLKDMR